MGSEEDGGERIDYQLETRGRRGMRKIQDVKSKCIVHFLFILLYLLFQGFVSGQS